MSETLLVTGATGQLGRLVIRNLLESQKVAPERIIAVTRKPDDARDLAAKGVTVRKGDFDDAASLDSAFAGADRILIISTDAVGVPGKRIAQHKTAVAAAAKAGAKRILYTSMPGPETSEVAFAPDHTATEEAIKASGVPYTILRASWYQEGLLNSLPNVVKSGKWVTATKGGKLAHLSREDIAAGAAGALANPPAESGFHTLTGDTSRSYAEIAALVTKVTGKPIEIVEVDEAAYAEGLRGAGLPPPVADLVTSIERNIRKGNFDLVTDEAERFAGRKPQTLEAFLEKNKAKLLG